MKVRIAFVTRPDSDAPDVDRIGGIEDHPVEDAKRLIKEGIAAAATDDEIANFEALRAREAAIAEAEAPDAPRAAKPKTARPEPVAEQPTSGTP